MSAPPGSVTFPATFSVQAPARPRAAAIPPHQPTRPMARSFLVALAAAALAACSSGSDSTEPVLTGARVRVIHLIPDAPAVDLRINGALPDQLRGLSYIGTSPYLATPARTTVITAQVSPSTNPDTPVPLLTSSRLDLQQRTDYTFLLSGRTAPDALPEEGPGFTPYTDDNSAPPAGTTRVRVIHASSDGGAVDVYALPVGTTTVPQGATALMAGLSFRSARTATPTAGSYALLVTRAGERATLLLRQDNVTLTAGAGVTVLARGFARPGTPGGQQLALQILTDRTP